MLDSAAAVSIRALDVGYAARRRSVTALRGVDLAIAPGESVAVVGESGSGKSTLSQALLGILPGSARIAADECAVLGRSTLGLGEREWEAVRGHDIGYIPQDPGVALNPLLTVGAHFRETFRALRPEIAAADADAEAILALESVGIGEPERRLSQRPWMLSGGMRQRVLIALALVGAPRLLIADEPTSALDVTVQKRVLDLIDDVRSRLGSALLLVTHDLAVALERADRIVVMRRGEIVEEGSREQILKAPRHEYTRGLLRDSLRVLDLPGQVRVGAAAGGEGSAPPETALAVEGVAKSFGGPQGAHAVLRGVDLAVRRGETLALIGESGSGKSTLARIAVGLETPTEGRVRIGATERPRRLGRRERRRLAGEIQFVHQNPFASLDPRWSVRRIVEEPLEIAGTPKRERAQRAARALEEVGLGSGFHDRLPRELSGGQRQRVAIARAIASGAGTIVLDEAVSALDVTVQAQILALLVELQREHGLAYLFITHDLAVVEAFADRVALIADGAIVEERPARELFEAPRTPQARELLDAIPRLAPPAALAVAAPHETAARKEPIGV